MQVRLITKTVGIEGTEYESKSLDQITVGIARLSSSREINELFTEPHKLLRHCISNGHWSVLNTTNLGVEIETSRAVGRQLLRHWSLKPQELSQRYAEITSFEEVELRKQCKNNRQSSEDVLATVSENEHKNHFNEYENIRLTEVTEEAQMLLEQAKYTYERCLEWGVSRETSRMLLPETATTKIIFNGTLREWVTTLNQRLHKTAQKETRLVCEVIRDCFMIECPIISKCLYNFEDAYEIHILDRLVLEKFGVYDLVKNNGYKKLYI
jgi:flavin-dependent thymidylate synthase